MDAKQRGVKCFAACFRTHILTSLYIWDSDFVFFLRLFMTIHWRKFLSPLQRKSMSTRLHLGNDTYCFMNVGRQWMDWSCIYSRQGIQRYRSNLTMAGHTTIMSLLPFQLLSSMFQVLSTTARLRSYGKCISNWSMGMRWWGGSAALTQHLAMLRENTSWNWARIC